MSTFYGIDISNNNGNVDLSRVKAAGYPFVYIKATEGQSFKDRYMETYYNDCKDLELKVGAYHFLVSTSTPEAQAENFYSMIKDCKWDLVPMMDVETMAGFTSAKLCDYVERFISKFNELSSLKLGIYTYTSFIENLEGCKDVIKDMPFWEANYGRSVWRLDDTWFTNRIGHQYTEEGIVPGVNTKCDVDVFTEGVLLETEPEGDWVQKDGKWWWKYPNGTWPASQWLKIRGQWYYFDSEGYIVLFWHQIDNTWYYFWSNGMMATGWLHLNDKWYYLGNNGAMQYGWVNYEGTFYYLDAQGVMLTSCYTPDGYWVCSDGSWDPSVERKC